MKPLVVAGFSHRSISVALLPRCYRTREQTHATLRSLQAEGLVRGGVWLQTCNRAELLLELAPDIDLHAEAIAARGFAADAPARPYVHRGDDALRHLIRVASSLDSLVIGEAQIASQVKDAFQRARDEHLLSSGLDLVLREVLRSAKEIRTQTEISSRQVSIASLAVDALRENGSFAGRGTVAILGAGVMAKKAVNALAGRSPVDLLVVNRTPGNAERLARTVGGRVLALHDFLAAPPPVVALISAVSCDRAPIDPDLARRLAQARPDPGLPLALVDLAVPANVDPECAAVPGVLRIGIDDLRAVAERNRAEREHEARAAEPLVERAVARARTALLEREADLGSVHRLHAEIAEQELGAIFGRRLAHLGEDDREALSAAVRRLAARHAHLHLSSLKDRIAGGVA